ncbi:hypothetical protein AGMMS50267_16810 [Spirochaetia bacterium]|nr:hypothetical protein AGMMS50267_16810 [Spirochaetia bacterium]
MWDTGATNSCISQRLAKHLGLTFIDLCDVEGVHGIEPAKVYLVDILLPNTVSINNVHVTEFFDNDDFEVIIGMDIITKGDLAMSNSGGKTIVSFRIPPGQPPIDFNREDGRIY